MSKSNSGLFHGTLGSRIHATMHENQVITSRVSGLDLLPHPRTNNISARTRKEIGSKINSRTATKNEYKLYSSDKRFRERRKAGVNEFWQQERRRIKTGQKPTREWSDSQRIAILSGQRPKYKGKTIQGHHTFSATQFPHLANKGVVIYPVAFDEHLYGWHGGNFKNSLPGKAIKFRQKHDFRRMR